MYISIKRIGKNKRPYAYLQESKRVGKKVKTTSIYIGPVGSLAKGILSLRHAGVRDGVFKPVDEMFADKAARDALDAAAANQPVTIDGLTMTTQQTAEESWQHESGIENAAPPGAATPSSSGEEG